MSIQTLIQDHGATNIILALTKYLKENVLQCHITPTEYNEYDIYKRIIADIPSVQGLSDGTIQDAVQVMPATKGKERKKAQPAHFNCTLIHDRPDVEDVGLHGKFVICKSIVLDDYLFLW